MDNPFKKVLRKFKWMKFKIKFIIILLLLFIVGLFGVFVYFKFLTFQSFQIQKNTANSQQEQAKQLDDVNNALKTLNKQTCVQLAENNDEKEACEELYK